MTALATDSGRKTPARLAGSAILSCQSDDRLVKLVRSGHERAFDVIVQRYRKPLVNYCRRILPESRCEDAVQQAFINAHAALIDSDDAVKLKPWLYAITRNSALNMLRQNGWNYEQIPLDFDGVRRPDQVVEQRIELQQTVAALNDLPARQRDALVLREFEGRSYDEIALALGANDGAVRQLLNRARVTLRNAATLLTPPPLLARAAASMPPADGRRAAELFAGLGAAGVAKAGATALVAGSLVVGAVRGPLPLTDHKSPPAKQATLAPAQLVSDDTSTAHDTPIAKANASHANRGRAHAPAAAVRNHSSHSGSSHRSGSGERETGQRDTRDRSGGGSDDNGTRERSGSDDSPTSGSGDRSGTSGGSGSDDAVTIVSGGDDASGTSGSSGSSGTSGSGDVTSGSSGSSGTSGSSGGSGSDDVTTSSTSGSGSSGSGSSGSGSSGSGSSDSGSSTTTSTSGSGTSGSGSGTSGTSNTLEH